jgi:hypothetical protein
VVAFRVGLLFAEFLALREFEAIDLGLGHDGANTRTDVYIAPQPRSLTLGLEGDRFARKTILTWLMVQHALPTL